MLKLWFLIIGIVVDSAHTKHALEDLHPNIAVFRHPDHLPDKKTIVHDIFGKIKGGTYKFGDGIKGLMGVGDDIELYFSHHEKVTLSTVENCGI
jgi:phospholipase D1/2